MNTEFYGRREFLKGAGLAVGSVVLSGCTGGTGFFDGAEKKKANILFAIADDWSWPHASIAGDKVVKTPTFDRVAGEGVMFTNAFVSAPSCTPSRGAILTGQWHWRLEDGGNLFGTLPAKFTVYPDMLEQAGYHVGYMRKGWSPGQYKPGGWKRNPAGKRYKGFEQFMQERQKWRSGVESGMKLEDVNVPACLPDNETVRTDICDYFWEVQRFDRQVGEILETIEDAGELDNTLVVITSDNGMPFPRCKSNIYRMGTHVPLAVRWPDRVEGGRVVEDFVSLTDLAPTFLEAAGLKVPAEMTGRSFMNILMSAKSGRVDHKRDKVFTGKERHVPCRPGAASYPMRAIRTHNFLYIRNFKPELWPAGDPDWREGYWPKTPYGDIDGSPTKSYMMDHRDEAQVRKLFELGFGKRPAEELYDLRNDPGELNNVADKPEYATVRDKLAATLISELKATNDPRVIGGADAFDNYPFYRG
ncbi:MAG: sulfatase family protein [Planctomycetota bacterium]|jgi:uncharacterized sulfatase